MADQQTQPRPGGPFAGIVAWGTKVTAWALATKPVRTWFHFLEHHGPMLADSVTYRTLFSVFAGLFLGFAIGGIWLAGRPDVIDALVSTISMAIPGLIGEDGVIDPDDLVQPITLSIAGVIALVGVVGAAIGAVGALRVAFRNLADQPDDQTFFVWVLLRDFVLAVGFGAALAAAAVVTFVSTNALTTLFDWLGISTREPLFDVLARGVSLLVIFAIDTVVIAAMFRVLSGIRPSRRALWTGSLLGGVGLLVLQLLSSLFVGAATNNPLFASFASLVALLLWFNLSSMVILIAGAYIVISDDEEHDRVHARHGATTFALRRLLRAERRATDAATELSAARAAVDEERAAHGPGAG